MPRRSHRRRRSFFGRSTRRIRRHRRGAMGRRGGIKKTVIGRFMGFFKRPSNIVAVGTAIAAAGELLFTPDPSDGGQWWVDATNLFNAIANGQSLAEISPAIPSLPQHFIGGVKAGIVPAAVTGVIGGVAAGLLRKFKL